MHRTTRSLSIAAAAITVGALALPVSAAIAETSSSSTGDTSVATSTDSTTPSPTASTPAAEEVSATDSTEPTTQATEPADTEATEPADDASEPAPTPATTPTAAPVAEPATPWHVKARLVDADSAVITWRDADTGDVSFSISLVPSGSTSAAVLPAVTATGSGRSVQVDGLVAGTRYRATVTATTTDGTAVSAPSNTVVAPKPKHVKHPAPRVAGHRTVTKHAGAPQHAKATKPKAKHGGKVSTAGHGSHRRG